MDGSSQEVTGQLISGSNPPAAVEQHIRSVRVWQGLLWQSAVVACQVDKLSLSNNKYGKQPYDCRASVPNCSLSLNNRR